ncbi:Putative Sensor histidine kinase YycG [Candidatus Phycorickettsia trachydisci]|uniref:histidine kinase n=1 Tax=Candidatus Phycorickettsia trachydisci TaxID=2115978 RepID=A0A2P1P9A7_9RICK|nr:ATP-binding protein [Candidatus Phycorickettsia trachydisci]AVP87843.1 Putative Sensor histidine kinase YycG [Candidatus Phycorickettsia trachydisci]
MTLNLDSIIFISFLLASVVIGLFSSYGVRTIKEYAIGNKNFTTATIAATIVATWASGNVFFGMVEETYKNGLYQILGDCADVICMFSIGIILAPRMGEFLDKLSIAEAMGDLYGTGARAITAITGLTMSVGVIAAQLQVSGLIFSYCFNCPTEYGIIAGGVIMGLYSTLGGVRSVTFTDVIQLITFATMLPTLAFFIFDKMHVSSILSHPEVTQRFFNFHEVFDFTRPKSLYYLCLFLFNGIPGFGPAFFQRVAISKDTRQITKSFVIAGFIWFFIIISIDFISILTFSAHPNLVPINVVKFIIFDQSYPGLRGFILAGIMAMIMSTADSYTNSASVLFVHDLCKPLGMKIKKELLITRIISAILVLGAIGLSLASNIGTGKISLMQFLIAAHMFYMPVVTVPFLLAVFGFRSSTKAVLIGMAAGAITVFTWEQFLQIEHIPGIIPGMVANMVFLFASHYLLRQEGGWIGIKDQAPLIAIKQERSARIKKFIKSIKEFNFSKFMEKNSPNNELMYIYTGLFACISLYANMATVNHYIKLNLSELFQIITPSVLFSATALLSYPLWLEPWKRCEVIAHIVWNIVSFYGLIFIGFLFAIISSFSTFQVMILMINLIMIAVLVRWQWALTMIILGAVFSVNFANIYLPGSLNLEAISLRLQLIYILLFIGSLLIIFIKPKQERQSLVEEKVLHLGTRLVAQEKQVLDALSLKSEFIRNMQHEYHTPMTGIMAMSQMLYDSHDNLSDKEKKEAAEVIFKSFVRLESFDSNLASLAKLNKNEFQLKPEDINFSELLQERIKTCRKLYEEEDSTRGFIVNLPDEEIRIWGDKYYLQQMLDNLIINAIMYCEHGLIEITLERLGNRFLRLYVRDSGIGIPPSELLEVFGEFMVSSKTRTPSGGRGIGLALCKKVVTAHQGNILAESDGESWTLFTVTLPLR